MLLGLLLLGIIMTVKQRSVRHALMFYENYVKVTISS